MTTLSKVSELIVKQEGFNFTPKPCDSFNKLGMDSISMIELIISVELEFDIEVSDDDYMAMRTVGDLVRVVKNV